MDIELAFTNKYLLRINNLRNFDTLLKYLFIFLIIHFLQSILLFFCNFFSREDIFHLLLTILLNIHNDIYDYNLILFQFLKRILKFIVRTYDLILNKLCNQMFHFQIFFLVPFGWVSIFNKFHCNDLSSLMVCHHVILKHALKSVYWT